MATAEPKQVMTPERAAEMERELQEFRAQQAAENARATREQAAKLIATVDSEGFKSLHAALPELDALAADTERYPNLRVHLDALRHGMNGVRQVVEMLPAAPPADQDGAGVTEDQTGDA